jgi:hypothetical protein
VPSPPHDQRELPRVIYLFLDFDGVLHPEGVPHRRLFERLPAVEEILLAHPQVRVVVSSTWRLRRSISELRQLFDPGVAGQVIGRTPHLDDGQPFARERECLQWLRSHADAWSAWVALDDRPWLFKPFCRQLIPVPWQGQGIEPEQLAELVARIRAAT